MKKKLVQLASLCLAAALLAACSAPPASSTSAPDASASASAPADSSAPAGQPAGEVSLKDDFYEAVNAEWLATTEVPADKPSAGGFTDLNEGIETTLMEDFAAMMAEEAPPEDPRMANFVEYYRQAADFEARDAAGAEPLQPYLQRIEALNSLEDYQAAMPGWILEGMATPFALSVMADMGNAQTNALYASAPGAILPDVSYYAEGNETGAALLAAYSGMAQSLLELAGKTAEEATALVEDTLAFDQLLVPYLKTAEEASDYTSMYNPVSSADFAAQSKSLDFAAIMAGLVGQDPGEVIQTDPKFFAAFDEVVNAETFPLLKSWMVTQTVASFSPYLSEDFRVTASSYSMIMSGTTEPTPKEEDAYYLASGVYSEVVGDYYGRTYFGEQAKADVTAMVEAMVAVYKSRLENNEWLSDATREKAIAKLDAMSINVGYPDKIDPLYDELTVTPAAEGGTLLGNVMALTKVLMAHQYAKWNQPVNRAQWPLSASTVNAMYSPMNNSINFPAAILQAPFYSLEQSASANYGGIGAVIAHEISHAFDPNGSKFDEYGNLAEWWTEEDHAKFEELSAAMVAQFDGVEFAGGQVNGQLTVSENVADAGGLSCALEAAKAEPDADLEAFFRNWATIWRQKSTPEYDALLLQVDVHAPSKLRGNIQLQNLEDFYTTFEIAEGDGMYRAPGDRVNIW